MRQEELISLIENSSPDDWDYYPCWGANSGESYHEGHTHLAIFKPDICIHLSWGNPGRGMEDEPGYEEEWSKNLPDSKIRGYYIDFFYYNSLFYRIVGVSIDGGRCIIPQPRMEMDDKKEKVIYWIPKSSFKFFRMFNQFEIKRNFDRYIKRLDKIIIKGDKEVSLIDD